ncbi:MAG TPA: amidohydrolase family protein [Gaiellaceae bacterium]|nr:amidohydrolase family protein [Gaiellaceae bacterium]
MGGLLRGRRGIRATGSFREVLDGVALVDHHAHGILRAPPATLDEFRGLFSEATDPRQWPHIATGVTYRRAVRAMAAHLGCEPTEEAVHAARLAADPAEYAAGFLRATNTELLLVDDGFPPTDAGTSWDEMGELAGCRALPVLRLETRGDHAAEETATARERGYVGLKTIAAYRGGLDRVSEDVVAALEANEATGAPLPLQVHCGFGDSDLHLWRSDPTLLKPLVERFSETTFVLLHCWPFVRQAGWLAHVYPNVCFDLSLTIPHVARPEAALAEALELAPVSKLLYASDAARTPELYLLAATWWRDALAAVLPQLLAGDELEPAARAILRDNALRVYGL